MEMGVVHIAGKQDRGIEGGLIARVVPVEVSADEELPHSGPPGKRLKVADPLRSLWHSLRYAHRAQAVQRISENPEG